MDVPALSLLQQQKSKLLTISNADAPDKTFDQYETILTTTQEVIQKVSVHAENISIELEKVQEVVKLCSVTTGEQARELIKNHLLKEQAKLALGSEGVPYPFPKPENSDMTAEAKKKKEHAKREEEKAKQRVQVLEKQQQDLTALIARTKTLALNIDENADISLSEVMGISNLLSQWQEGLETLEEKEKKLKGENEQYEKTKLEKKEAEQRQKEREKQEAEAKRRTEEKEAKRRDWKNWPPFVQVFIVTSNNQHIIH